MGTPREKWLPVVGFEGFYEVSSLGRVRSLWSGDATLLKLTREARGYQAVNLCDGKVRKNRLVHALVAEAFIGPRPRGAEVSHMDGKRANSRLSNLCYETHAENCQRRAEHGTAYRPRGEEHHSAKLTVERVAEVFKLYERGRLQREIADEMGVTQGQISRVLGRKSWTQA